MSELDWPALRTAVSGQVLTQDDEGYDDARRPQIARFQHVRPAAVVRCRTDADVAATLAFARDAGLALVVRSGGHCFEGRSSTEGIVLDVGEMNRVVLSGGLVRAGAGARLGDVYDTLTPHGLTLPAGCGPTVGIAGLTLGGGLGILGRRHGLTADRLRAARVVLSDGRAVDCAEDMEPDLFWALRGGGHGTVGVVTSLVFEPVPAPDATAFHLTWDAGHLTGVLAAWQDWSPAAPDAMAASLVVSTGADPAAPPVVAVFGAASCDEGEAAALLDAFVARVGAAPAAERRERHTHRETKRWLTEVEVHGEPPRPDGHAHSRSEYVPGLLPEDAVSALVAHLLADRRPGEERELDLTPWGGAYNRVAPSATAFAHRAERFLLKQTVVVAGDAGADERIAARDWLDGSWEIVHPYGSGGVYPNFPDPVLDDPVRAYYGVNADRLRTVAKAYDPDGMFPLP